MENNKKLRIYTFIFVILIIVISLCTIIFKPKELFGSSSKKATDTLTLNTNYLSISDVKVETNSSYTICTGTITVIANSPYKYRFIEVKGSFKNSYGSVVDTDSTYAIGSEGLEPGESKTFRLSVPKNSTIKTCSVSIME